MEKYIPLATMLPSANSGKLDRQCTRAISSKAMHKFLATLSGNTNTILDVTESVTAYIHPTILALNKLHIVMTFLFVAC